MTIKCILITLCAVGIKTSMASIAGVTYMDDFDFEERYTDPNECNPFYWHPLHLPEKCAELYEKAIRKKVASSGPVRIMTRKPKARKHSPRKSYYRSSKYSYGPIDTNDYFSIGDIFTSDNSDDSETRERTRKSSSPYQQMMDQLRKDIHYLPTAAKITTFPGIGPVALYQQPISKSSKLMIQKIAKIYGKNNRHKKYQYPFGQSEVYLQYKDQSEEDSSASKANQTLDIE